MRFEEIDRSLVLDKKDFVITLYSVVWKIRAKSAVDYEVLTKTNEVLEDFTSFEEALLFVLKPHFMILERR